MSRDSTSTSISSLIIPQLYSRRGWKPSERVSEDTNPSIVWRESEDDSSSRKVPTGPTSKDETTCSICQKHQSRYTCPRCQLPYCSVACYRNHSSSTKDMESSQCTEAFYKDRVSSLLQLEAQEQKTNTHRILNQQYQKSLQNTEDEEDLSDQLYNLLDFLEEQQDGKLSHEDVLALMPPELRAQFHRDIQEGKIQEMILQPWHPWWRRQLVSMEAPVLSSNLIGTTLDERLLGVPKLASLSTKQQSSPFLLFHLIDIMYAFCWTIRLYHGLENVIAPPTHVKNADDGILAIEAAINFLQNSAVLSKDARYTSLEQVLSSCTASSTKAYPNGCNTEWSVLLEDCAHIFYSHRLVGRSLLESCDLIKSAMKQLKQEDVDGNKDIILRLRQVRKKLEFFLSWSQHNKAEFGDAIKADLLEWIQQWSSRENVDNGRELEIPNTIKATLGPVSPAPLITEIVTTRNFNNSG